MKIAASSTTSKNIFRFDSRPTGSSGTTLGFIGPSFVCFVFVWVIKDSRATGSSGSTLGFLGPSSSSSDEDSSSAEGIGDSAILYWNGGIGLL